MFSEYGRRRCSKSRMALKIHIKSLKSPVKILIVEDNRDIAANIGDYLEPHGHTLDFAEDGLEGQRLATTQAFDVIVLDLNLPKLDGISLCEVLRTQYQLTTPILMLTARDRLDDKLAGFRAGTDDYLVKPFSVKELEARLIALVNRSQSNQNGRILSVADLEFNLDTMTASRGDVPLDLNPAQRKILRMLMLHSHRVVTRQELEFELWGDNPPDKDILRTHIYTLRNIIDKQFDKKILHTVHGVGYQLHRVNK